MERADHLDGRYSHTAEIEAVKKALATELDHIRDATKMVPTAKVVRLTGESIDLLSVQYLDVTPNNSQINDFANAIMDAMIKKNGGLNDNG